MEGLIHGGANFRNFTVVILTNEIHFWSHSAAKK